MSSSFSSHTIDSCAESNAGGVEGLDHVATGDRLRGRSRRPRGFRRTHGSDSGFTRPASLSDWGSMGSRGTRESVSAEGSLVPMRAQMNSITLSSSRLQVLCYVLAEVCSASTLLEDYTRAMLNLPHRLLACWQGVMAAAVAWQRCDWALHRVAERVARRRWRAAHAPRSKGAAASTARPPSPDEGGCRRGNEEEAGTDRCASYCGDRHDEQNNASCQQKSDEEVDGLQRHEDSVTAERSKPALSSAATAAAAATSAASAWRRRRERKGRRTEAFLPYPGSPEDAASSPDRPRRDSHMPSLLHTKPFVAPRPLRMPSMLRWAFADYRELEDTVARRIEAVRELVIAALFQQYLHVVVTESMNDLVLFKWLEPLGKQAVERAEAAVLAAAAAFAYARLARQERCETSDGRACGRLGNMLMQPSRKDQRFEQEAQLPPHPGPLLGPTGQLGSCGDAEIGDASNPSITRLDSRATRGGSPRAVSASPEKLQREPSPRAMHRSRSGMLQSSRELFQQLRVQGKEAQHRFVQLSDDEEDDSGEVEEVQHSTRAATRTAAGHDDVEGNNRKSDTRTWPRQGKIQVLATRRRSSAGFEAGDPYDLDSGDEGCAIEADEDVDDVLRSPSRPGPYGNNGRGVLASCAREARHPSVSDRETTTAATLRGPATGPASFPSLAKRDRVSSENTQCSEERVDTLRSASAGSNLENQRQERDKGSGRAQRGPASSPAETARGRSDFTPSAPSVPNTPDSAADMPADKDSGGGDGSAQWRDAPHTAVRGGAEERGGSDYGGVARPVAIPLRFFMQSAASFDPTTAAFSLMSRCVIRASNVRGHVEEDEDDGETGAAATGMAAAPSATDGRRFNWKCDWQAADSEGEPSQLDESVPASQSEDDLLNTAQHPPEDNATGEMGSDEGYYYVVIARRAVGGCHHGRPCFGNRKFIFVACADPDVMVREDAAGIAATNPDEEGEAGKAYDGCRGRDTDAGERESGGDTAVRRDHRPCRRGDNNDEGSVATSTPTTPPSADCLEVSGPLTSPLSSESESLTFTQSGRRRSSLRRSRPTATTIVDNPPASSLPGTEGLPVELTEDWRQRMLFFGQELTAAAAPFIGSPLPPHLLPTALPRAATRTARLPVGAGLGTDDSALSASASSQHEYEEVGEDGLVRTRRQRRPPPPLPHPHRHTHHYFQPHGATPRASGGSDARERLPGAMAAASAGAPAKRADGAAGGSGACVSALPNDCRPCSSESPSSLRKPTRSPSSSASASRDNEDQVSAQASADTEADPDVDNDFIVLHCDHCSVMTLDVARSAISDSSPQPEQVGSVSWGGDHPAVPPARGAQLSQGVVKQATADVGALVVASAEPSSAHVRVGEVASYPSPPQCGSPLTSFEQTVLMPPGAGQSFLPAAAAAVGWSSTTAAKARPGAPTSPQPPPSQPPGDGDISFAQELFARMQFWCLRGQDRSSFVDPSHGHRTATATPCPSEAVNVSKGDCGGLPPSSLEEAAEAPELASQTTQKQRATPVSAHDRKALRPAPLDSLEGQPPPQRVTLPLKLLNSDVGYVSFFVPGRAQNGGGSGRDDADSDAPIADEEESGGSVGASSPCAVGCPEAQAGETLPLPLVVAGARGEMSDRGRRGDAPGWLRRRGVGEGQSGAWANNTSAAAFNVKGQSLLYEALLSSTEAVVVASRESRAHRGFHDRVHAASGRFAPQGTLSDDEGNPWAFDQHEHLGVLGAVRWLQGEQPAAPQPEVVFVAPDPTAVGQREEQGKARLPSPTASFPIGRRSSHQRRRPLAEMEQHQHRVERLRSEFRLARSACLDVLLVDRARRKPVAALTLLQADRWHGSSSSSSRGGLHDSFARQAAAAHRGGAPASVTGPQEAVEATTYVVGTFTHYIAPLWRYLREEKAILVDMDRTLVDNAITLPLPLLRRRLEETFQTHRAARQGGDTFMDLFGGSTDKKGDRSTANLSATTSPPGHTRGEEQDSRLMTFLAAPFAKPRTPEALRFEACKRITYKHSSSSGAAKQCVPLCCEAVNREGEPADSGSRATAEMPRPNLEDEDCEEVIYVRPALRQLLHRLAVQWGIPVVLVTKSTRSRTEAVLDSILDPDRILFVDRARQIITADELGTPRVQPPRPPQSRGPAAEKSAQAVLARYDGAPSHRRHTSSSSSPLTPARSTSGGAGLCASRLGKARSLTILDDSPQVWCEADWPATVAIAPYTLARVDPLDYLNDNGYIHSLLLSCLYGSKCVVCPSPAFPTRALQELREGKGRRAGCSEPHCVCCCPLSHSIRVLQSPFPTASSARAGGTQLPRWSSTSAGGPNVAPSWEAGKPAVGFEATLTPPAPLPPDANTHGEAAITQGRRDPLHPSNIPTAPAPPTPSCFLVALPEPGLDALAEGTPGRRVVLGPASEPDPDEEHAAYPPELRRSRSPDVITGGVVEEDEEDEEDADGGQGGGWVVDRFPTAPNSNWGTADSEGSDIRHRADGRAEGTMRLPSHVSIPAEGSAARDGPSGLTSYPSAAVVSKRTGAAGGDDDVEDVVPLSLPNTWAGEAGEAGERVGADADSSAVALTSSRRAALHVQVEDVTPL